ncbi:MAG TPA: lamin tail domain-containing protein [Thermoanaerobaculia bacterium]|nr:lamin tail domain-containing protein [Thermoanaerobaculia bacterium]
MKHLQSLRVRSLLFSLLFILVLAPSVAMAISGTVVISEFRVRGPNGGSDEFVELYNLSGASVDISGWKMKGSNNAGTTSTRATVPASTSLGPGCHFLFTNSSTSGGPYSGTVTGNVTYGTGITDDGGIAITTAADVIVDQVGMSTGSAFKEGTVLASLGSSNLNRGYERKPGGSAGSSTDTDNNSSDFQLITPSDPQNLSSPCIVIGNPSGTGAANPSAVPQGSTTILTVTVTPGSNPTSTGLQVQGDLTAIGGSATQTFYDDGSTGGDQTAGDNVFTYTATVAGATTAGNKSLPFTISDAQLRSGTGSIALSVVIPLAIHDIQGSGDTSPYAGSPVQTTGIVTGRKTNGFFIQSPDGFVDADPNTSEGIFVFTSSAPPAGAAVGNDVRVTGTVQEFIPSADPNSPPSTEIINPSVTVLSTGNPLPAPVVLSAADTDPSGPIDQLEKYEGMRVQVNSLTVTAPTQGTISEANATSTSNGVFYGVITGVARPFRERGIEAPDPLPSPGIPRFDGNPERIRVDSDGIGAPTLDVTTGAVLTNLIGPLDYAFRSYTIDLDPAVTVGVTPGISAAVAAPARAADQFTVACFNLERFFDTTDDPTVQDVALTMAAFNNRLNKASLAIRNVLRTPDILGVEEMENLPTLQALATKINTDAADPGVNYQAYLVEGNDIGGIDVGFLVNSARVNVIDVNQYGKDTTYTNPNNNQQEILNDRPPLVLRATVNAPSGGAAFPITVIVNHLRSFSGVDDPVDGPRVRAKRAAQAEFLANLIQTRQAADPTEHIVSVGDYNAYEFSDGYVDSIGTIIGDPDPCNEVVFCSSDLVDPNLIELAGTVSQAERYSYVFDGNGQVLDHVLITQNLNSRFDGLTYARNDADFAETFRNDPNRPERISDHDPAVAYFRLPLISSLSPAKVWVGLKNSDDVGIKFDLRAEVYYNGTTLIGYGELPSVAGGSSGFNNAKLDSIPLNLTTPVGITTGDTISIKLLVRNACSGSGHNSGTARLWFNDSQANSRFDATADDSESDLYLLDGSALGTSAGPGPKKAIDVSAGAKCSAFKPFGTWTATID